MKRKSVNWFVAGSLGAAWLLGSVTSLASHFDDPVIRVIRLKGSAFSLNQGGVKIFNLAHWVYIKDVRVAGEGKQCAGSVEIEVNGETRGTLELRSESSSKVEVNEVTGSITLINRGQCAAQIKNVHIYQDVRHVRLPGAYRSIVYGSRDGGSSGGGMLREAAAENGAALIAGDAIAVVQSLETAADHFERGHFLLPIKVVAARALAVANAYDILSWQTRRMLILLHAQLAYAGSYVNNGYQRDELFERVSHLFQIQLEIASRLGIGLDDFDLMGMGGGAGVLQMDGRGNLGPVVVPMHRGYDDLNELGAENVPEMPRKRRGKAASQAQAEEVPAEESEESSEESIEDVPGADSAESEQSGAEGGSQ